VQHITEVIAEAMDQGKIKLKEFAKTVSYQDPCRLGRHLGIYDEPRKAITSVPQLKLKEMVRNRKSAICCGVSAWMN
jgi:heterodisulfide reductase subunit D